MKRLSLYVDRIRSPIGAILILTDEQGRVRALEYEDHLDRMHRLLRRRYGGQGVALIEGRPLTSAGHLLKAYFAGDVHAIDRVEIEIGGTLFQRAVWSASRQVRPGETIGYGALAARIGRPAASRAVGLANGANPIPLVVPCHRVIGADGSLTGYGGGLDRKRWLLEYERTHCEGARVRTWGRP